MNPSDQASREQIQRLAHWLALPIDDTVVDRLLRYAQWLIDEAVPAGGLGPREASRIVDRHLCDSLSLLGAFTTGLPGRVVDLGSGVGLPGIPLAMVLPESEVTLVDRAGRRVKMLGRAIAVLGVDNATVVQESIEAVSGRFDGVVMRAAVPVEVAPGVMARLLEHGGTAALALSRVGPDLPDGFDHVLDHAGLAGEIIAVPPDVLESGAWILRMQHQ